MVYWLFVLAGLFLFTPSVERFGESTIPPFFLIMVLSFPSGLALAVFLGAMAGHSSVASEWLSFGGSASYGSNTVRFFLLYAAYAVAGFLQWSFLANRFAAKRYKTD